MRGAFIIATDSYNGLIIKSILPLPLPIMRSKNHGGYYPRPCSQKVAELG